MFQDSSTQTKLEYKPLPACPPEEVGEPLDGIVGAGVRPNRPERKDPSQTTVWGTQVAGAGRQED